MKNSCQGCDVITECRQAFGRYWFDKSSRGMGCNVKFPGYDIRKGEKKQAAAKVAVRSPMKDLFGGFDD